MHVSNTDYSNVITVYNDCKTRRDRRKPLWDDISKFVGIRTDPDYAWRGSAETSSSKSLDEFIDDPTAAISVNQAGDYLVGIMWGTGEGVLDIVPSRYVLELADKEEVKDFFDFATDQTLYHMNHSEAGYHTALRPYAYDQVAFGTSGVGIFPNDAFREGLEHNALVARNYGVDNVVIDAGKNGLVDIVFATYDWRVNRIVNEFCMEGGKVNPELLAKLPKKIRDLHAKNQLNERFKIVFGMMPRGDYNPKLKGKKGTKYRGMWFCDDANAAAEDKKFFMEEDFSEKPINMARMILIRGDVWGRASGTMLLSSIRAVNYMVGTAIEVIEKMADPALGTFSNAIFGDSVLDTSPSGITVFNSTFASAAGGKPTFPLYDVGDPSALIQFLVPYLNEKINTAFKVDALLDFSSSKEMTATESMQRFVIRGQSLSGILSQQKNERLVPDVKRSVSILFEMGELGINPRTNQDLAKQFRARNRGGRVIPESVLQVMDQGRPWFEIRFNNELERLLRTQKVQNLLQLLNSIIAISGLYPDIIEAVDWYKYLQDINDNLDANSKIMFTEVEFKQKVQALAEQRQAQAAMQMGAAAAEAGKTVGQTRKLNMEAASSAKS